jgi:CelD/BcsL family acetyltransferase involved in cellulose biosynthesis
MGVSESVHSVEVGSVPDELDTFRRSPSASFFQSAAWLRLVSTVLPHTRPWVICVRDAQDRLQAALPLLEHRRWGMRQLVGGPWGTYGGVLSHDALAVQPLLEFLEQVARRCSLVRIHDFAESLQTLPGSWRRVPESCQVVELPDDASELFARFTSQNRNKIRKAEKNGVEVTRHADAASLEIYASLYAELVQRLQVARPTPAALFRGLAACPGVEVWLARHDGTVVAGLLNLNWGGQIMNWGNVSRPEAWKWAPNNLLHWRALEAACGDATGPRLYNFGSSAVSEQVHTFKKSFAAVDRLYPRCEWMSPWRQWLERLRRIAS